MGDFVFASVFKELVFALEGPRDDVPSDVADVPQADKEGTLTNHLFIGFC